MTRVAIVVGAVVALLVATVPGPAIASGSRPAQATEGATVLESVQPCRLFDGRATPGRGRLDAATWRVQVAGRCGVAADARAAAISIVATATSAPGFVTVWPSGSIRPKVSNLNFDRNNTVANSAVVQLNESGAIDVFASAPADLIVDVTAAFTDVQGGGAGRFVAMQPRRLVDTRRSGRSGADSIVVPLPAGVAPDAIAAAVTVTAVDAAKPGFLTVHGAGTPLPDSSLVNTDELNPTRANVAFVPVTADGISISRSMPTDVLVDIWGWFTGPSAPATNDGLFVPQAPARVWDSRSSFDPIHAGGTIEKTIAPPTASAVVANVTAVEPTGWGFMTVTAAGTVQPDVSSLNYQWRQAVAALTVTRNSDRGVSFRSHAGTHVVVDVAGWFVGTPIEATAPRGRNPLSAENERVLFVSDSSLAGIRWGGALGWLQGASFDNRLESCRRLIGSSCRGREGYAPPTANDELASVPAGAFDTAVIATGYNDWSGLFPIGLDAVLTTARSKGIQRVVWMTYRENVGYSAPAGAANRSTFIRNNLTLEAAVASGRYPELILADWRTYSQTRADWVTADGVHLTTAGARAAAEYTSRKLAALHRRPCPLGIGGPATAGGWCADPDATGPS